MRSVSGVTGRVARMVRTWDGWPVPSSEKYVDETGEGWYTRSAMIPSIADRSSLYAIENAC